MSATIENFLSTVFSYFLDYIGDITDAVLYITLVAVTALTLTGCTISTPEQVETAVYHPAWPAPYETCDVEWKIMVVDKEPFVALSFEDNLKMAACTEDLIRYLKEMNIKFCTYRPKEDSRCAKILTQKEKTT